MRSGIATAKWSVTVFDTTPQGCKTLRQESLEALQTSVIASWEVGNEGQEWIEALVEQRKARLLRSSWLPRVYIVPAKHVRSLDLWDWIRLHQTEGMVTEFPEDQDKPGGRPWYGFMHVRQFHPVRLQTSALDAVWTIEVWDIR